MTLPDAHAPAVGEPDRRVLTENGHRTAQKRFVHGNKSLVRLNKRCKSIQNNTIKIV